ETLDLRTRHKFLPATSKRLHFGRSRGLFVAAFVAVSVELCNQTCRRAACRSACRSGCRTAITLRTLGLKILQIILKTTDLRTRHKFLPTSSKRSHRRDL